MILVMRGLGTARNVAILACTIILNACGPAELSEPYYKSMKGLVAQDLKQLEDESAEDIPTDRPRIRQLFQSAYGGTSGTAIRHFIDERIQYFLDPQDLFGGGIYPPSTFNGWSNTERPLTSVTDDSVVMGASNMGSPNWFQGLLDGNTKTFIIPRLGLRIRLDAPRVGIMVIGPGYSETRQIKKQDWQTTPEFRQSILVHEARHSDCTGGLRQRDLTAARSASNTGDFEAKFTQQSCNHFHVICPPGHQLAGYPACDRHPWGSYSFGYLYAVGKRGPNLSFREKFLLDYAASDSLSRLLFLRDIWGHTHAHQLLNGRFGTPDVSSSGVID